MASRLIVFFALLLLSAGAWAETVRIYPQSFRGGWGLDVASTEVIGSPYLIAHGLGRVVPDATAEAVVPRADAGTGGNARI